MTFGSKANLLSVFVLAKAVLTLNILKLFSSWLIVLDKTPS